MQGTTLSLVNDEQRLEALRRCCLLDTHAEAAFDRLTRLASRVLGAPVSLVSLVDTDRQFFKSAVGLNIRETPLSHSFCKHVVDTGEPLVIPDARQHPLVHDNPAIHDLNVSSYLGMPLNTSDGHAVGSLCVIDDQPHDWTPDEIELLRELAVSVMMEIELRVKMRLQQSSGKRVSDTDLYGNGNRSAEQFGVYIVEERIGKGGMCEVFRCKHSELGVSVAIKRLLAAHATSSNFKQRFEREARIVSQLKHPNIIRVFDYGIRDTDDAYMVMEYIHGQTLAEYMQQRGTLPLSEAVNVLRDVAAALDYAHGMGIIHRDVKPSNIMLRSELDDGQRTGAYHATLMDFGVAKMTREQSRLTQEGAIGTLDYAAPEQIQSAPNVDHRADIYSLGIILYKMMTGRLPFTGDTLAQVIHGHLSQPVPDPRRYNPSLPPHAAAAIERALSKSPVLRFDSATQFIETVAEANRQATV